MKGEVVVFRVWCISQLELLTEWLKQQKLVSHSSGGREAQDQGANQFSFKWGLSSWFVDGCLLTVSPRAVWECRRREREGERGAGSTLLSPLIRTPLLSDKSPTLMTSFNLNYLLKALSPRTVTLEVEASIWLWGGGRARRGGRHKHSVHNIQVGRERKIGFEYGQCFRKADVELRPGCFQGSEYNLIIRVSEY